MTSVKMLTIVLPSLVGVIYFVVGAAYVSQRNWPWALIWTGYAVAQVGLVWSSLRM